MAFLSVSTTSPSCQLTERFTCSARILVSCRSTRGDFRVEKMLGWPGAVLGVWVAGLWQVGDVLLEELLEPSPAGSASSWLLDQLR